MDRPILDDMTIGDADIPAMRQGAAVFARAMGRGEAHVEEWLFRFSRRLAEAGIGHFMAASYRGKTVGYGSLVAYSKLGWIGFMGTEPSLQGKGIGAAIMEELLGRAQKMGLTSLKLDATNIGKRLYTKFGFKEEYAARRFEIPGQCKRGSRRGMGVGDVRIAGHIPSWCLALDRRAFGDDRRPLIEAALRDGAKLLVTARRGFAVMDGKKLGPLVATDTHAAIELIRWGAGLGANLVYVPRHAELPSPFTKELRLPEEAGPITCCTRMTMGEPIEQDLRLVYADHSAATG